MTDLARRCEFYKPHDSGEYCFYNYNENGISDACYCHDAIMERCNDNPVDIHSLPKYAATEEEKG